MYSLIKAKIKKDTMTDKNLTLSLVTVCYNSEKTIQKCLSSVLNNKNRDFEYIIVDGKSTDDTLEIITKNKPKFKSAGIPLRIISEPDDGLYDAMNKGIALAQGKWIWFINSDDYLENDALDQLLMISGLESFDLAYGMLTKISEKLIYQIGKRNLQDASKDISFNHPATIVKRKCFQQFGNFNIKYKTCADYDFFCKLVINDAKVLFVEKNLAYMNEGGISDKLSSYVGRGKEHFEIEKNYFGLVTAIRKSISFFAIGFTKKVIKDLLIKIGNSYILKKYYSTKYNRVT
jgi:glycosyltransferase involved in cell wall biosynthesis